MRNLRGALQHTSTFIRCGPRSAAGQCGGENRPVPLQLLVVPLVGVAAGQDRGPGEAAGFDPGKEQLSEALGFVLWGPEEMKIRVETMLTKKYK